MPTLSIIIPIYRVEQTLNRCMESIVGQTFNDWEAILVDDGSPDGCPALCDQWAATDQRIVAIHRANGGLSAARNTGLAEARGDYVTFADPDDYLADANTYHHLVGLLCQHKELDLLEYPFAKCDDQGRLLTTFNPGEQRYADAADYWFRGKAYLHAYAWNKVYRRSLFGGLGYPEGRVFEDVHLLPQLLRRTCAMATTSQGCYHYVVNPTGITQQAGASEWQSLLDAHLSAMAAFLPESPSAVLRPEEAVYYMHVLNVQLTLQSFSPSRPQLARRRVPVLTPGLSPHERIKAFLLRTIGINRLCQLYPLINRQQSSRS